MMIDDLVRAHACRDNQAREQACTAALQSGTHGVLAVRDPFTGLWSYEVSAEVSYGTIHEYRAGRL